MRRDGVPNPRGSARAHHRWLHPIVQVYCLPDGYEVKDASLEDVKVHPRRGMGLSSDPWGRSRSCAFQFVLHPHYTPELVSRLDTVTIPSHALDGSAYHPGIVGLNNIKNNDYINAVVHALAHVRPLRDFFLLEENYKDVRIQHKGMLLSTTGLAIELFPLSL